jgi:predicted NAD-dependent protein-ADP-ribosyltransferase YbiA (DUF1768 family)
MKATTPEIAKYLAEQNIDNNEDKSMNNIIQKYLDFRVSTRYDWNNVKDNIMYYALYTKFTRNKKLRMLLLSTNNAILIDESDKSKQNKLGRMLMKLRRELIS